MNSSKINNRILIVDDDPDIVELLEYNLDKENYISEKAYDGKEAIKIAKTFKPHLIIMDVMMPQMDGIEAARILKEDADTKNCLILFLTARGEEFTEVAAFEAGAYDYLVKPIKPRALMTRINAIFSRKYETKEEDKKNEKIEIGDIVIDRVKYMATYKGKPLSLPKKEFELLFHFVNNPNKVFNRDELLEKVWGADVYVVERTVDVHIRKLREKIPEHYIKTLKGVGYLFSTEN